MQVRDVSKLLDINSPTKISAQFQKIDDAMRKAFDICCNLKLAQYRDNLAVYYFYARVYSDLYYVVFRMGKLIYYEFCYMFCEFMKFLVLFTLFVISAEGRLIISVIDKRPSRC